MAVYANGGSVIFIEGTDDLNTVKDIATFAATMGHDGDLGIQANGYVELVGSAEVEIGISSSDSEIDTDGTSIVIKNVNNSNETMSIPFSLGYVIAQTNGAGSVDRYLNAKIKYLASGAKVTVHNSLFIGISNYSDDVS